MQGFLGAPKVSVLSLNKNNFTVVIVKAICSIDYCQKTMAKNK